MSEQKASFDGAQDERKKSRKGVGGPKTKAGKAVVRLNPIRHGVLAQTPVIPLVEQEEDGRAGCIHFAITDQESA